jgi:hypothetical protein
MIAALGGVRKTGLALGLAPTTVQHWQTTGAVPAWREDALKQAYASIKTPQAAA